MKCQGVINCVNICKHIFTKFNYNTTITGKLTAVVTNMSSA